MMLDVPLYTPCAIPESSIEVGVALPVSDRDSLVCGHLSSGIGDRRWSSSVGGG